MDIYIYSWKHHW